MNRANFGFMMIALTLMTTNLFAREKKMITPEKAKIAVTIRFEAKAGKEAELSALLTSAAEVVSSTEPKTLFWFATKVNERTFTINDGFADEDGLNAHFNGKVAALLKSKAGDLIVGGWEQGVLPNVVRSDILSTIK